MFQLWQESYYTRECIGCTNSKKKLENKKMKQKANYIIQKKNQIPINRVTIARSNALNKKSNDNFYSTKSIFITQKASTNQSNQY